MCGVARDGVAAVAADGECGGDFDGAVGSVGEDAGGDAVRVWMRPVASQPMRRVKLGKRAASAARKLRKSHWGMRATNFGVGGKVGEIGHGEGADRRWWRRGR